MRTRFSRDLVLGKERQHAVVQEIGYDNVRHDGHVERTVNEKEAAVVRDIYQRYADGEGFKQIAHALNAKKLPSPRPQRGRPAGWDPGTVRAVLKRSLYRGTVVYNKTKKRDTDGSRHKGRQPKRDKRDWITVERPELRLVSNLVSDQVEARLSSRRHAYLRGTKGRLLGRPRGSTDGKHLLAGFIQCACGATFEAVRDIGSRYLLSGFARGAECGWSMTVITRRHGKTRRPFLGCLSHYKRSRWTIQSSIRSPGPS